MRKRKQTYPPARTATSQQTANRDSPSPRSTVVSIDLTALTGGGAFAVGDRVRIKGSGLYAGETAVVEALARSAIPSVLIRTVAGFARRVRTIDLERLPPLGRAD
jgi:hypothetical protein